MNWKYIIIVIVLAAIAGGGILSYLQWIAKEEVRAPEVKAPEVKAPEEQKPEEEEEEIPIFPCIGSKIEPNTCTDKIDASTEKIIKGYLSNYVYADLSNAEIKYCLEKDEFYEHYWHLKTFYLDHWIGIEAACFTKLTELPIETPKLEKEFYRVSINIYAGTEYPLKEMARMDPEVAYLDINRRKTDLASAQSAQAELSKYGKLDTSFYNLKLEQTSDGTWAYIYRNLENMPQIYTRIEKQPDFMMTRYGMIQLDPKKIERLK